MTTAIQQIVPQEVPAYHKGLTGDIKGMRIALPKEYFAEGVDAQVQAAVLKAADQYREMGAIVEEVSLPHSKYGDSSVLYHRFI